MCLSQSVRKHIEDIENGTNSGNTRFGGLAALREAIAKKQHQQNGIEADAETDIVVSAGSTGALYCACLALLDPGDEVILFESYYGSPEHVDDCGSHSEIRRSSTSRLDFFYNSTRTSRRSAHKSNCCEYSRESIRKNIF